MIRAIQFQNKRVGSTFLQKALNSHSEIEGIDEIFVNVSRKDKYRKSGFIPYINFYRITGENLSTKEYIEDVVNRTYPNTNTIFKLMYNQIEYHAGLLDYIISAKIPIIHVIRKNLLKQVISFYKMAEYNHQPITATPDQIFRDVEEADRLNKRWSKLLNRNIGLVLYYEDMIGDRIDCKTYMSNNANIAVCDFFKIPQQRLFANTTKKNKDDISFYLPNFKDVKARFKNTQYEWMI